MYLHIKKNIEYESSRVEHACAFNNKYILKTGMQLCLILSCDVYSIGHQG
jgi:hypothetical protein